MLIPPTMLVPHEELFRPAQSSPELRRMEMYNRARREEIETLLFDVNPRHGGRTVSTRRHAHKASIVSRSFQGLRNGIGSVLIAAGNRIQSPA